MKLQVEKEKCAYTDYISANKSPAFQYIGSAQIFLDKILWMDEHFRKLPEGYDSILELGSFEQVQEIVNIWKANPSFSIIDDAQNNLYEKALAYLCEYRESRDLNIPEKKTGQSAQDKKETTSTLAQKKKTNGLDSIADFIAKKANDFLQEYRNLAKKYAEETKKLSESEAVEETELKEVFDRVFSIESKSELEQRIQFNSLKTSEIECKKEIVDTDGARDKQQEKGLENDSGIEEAVVKEPAEAKENCKNTGGNENYNLLVKSMESQPQLKSAQKKISVHYKGQVRTVELPEIESKNWEEVVDRFQGIKMRKVVPQSSSTMGWKDEQRICEPVKLPNGKGWDEVVATFQKEKLPETIFKPLKHGKLLKICEDECRTDKLPDSERKPLVKIETPIKRAKQNQELLKIEAQIPSSIKVRLPDLEFSTWLRTTKRISQSRMEDTIHLINVCDEVVTKLDIPVSEVYAIGDTEELVDFVSMVESNSRFREIDRKFFCRISQSLEWYCEFATECAQY